MHSKNARRTTKINGGASGVAVVVGWRGGGVSGKKGQHTYHSFFLSFFKSKFLVGQMSVCPKGLNAPANEYMYNAITLAIRVPQDTVMFL